MLLRSVAIVAAIAFLGAAEPSWRTPGACITPSGTLCRTLVYESSGWVNRGWGFHAVERYRDQITEAVRRDGAALLRISHRSFKFYLFPSEQYDRSRVVFPVRHQTLEIEHSLKQFRDMGGVWSFVEFWTDEPDCSKRAASAGETWRKTGEQPVVAGIRAVEYLYETADQRVVQRIAFAPSLGCTAVAFTLSERNASGLPVSEDTLKLVFATLAEPDRTLFTIPAGYQETRSEEPWPYISMNNFPGEITTTGFSLPEE